MKRSTESTEDDSASDRISRRIAELGDWRGETLGRIRALIKEADPDIVEEWKWMGTPVWSHDGIVCTGESYKKVVKMTFAKGAALDDPSRLFNSSLEGNVRRAIDVHEGEALREGALKKLVQSAVTLNTEAKQAKKKPSARQSSPAVAATSAKKRAPAGKAPPATKSRTKLPRCAGACASSPCRTRVTYPRAGSWTM